MTLVGCIVAIALLATGHKPRKWGYCYYFEVGERWGGVELGPFFVVNKNASDYTKSHELGHTHQNCRFGPLMPFIVCIPSATRYWYRRIRKKIGKPCTTGYYDIWFERRASDVGAEFMNWYKNNTK